MDNFKTCPNCHSKNDIGAKFCRECGNELIQPEEKQCKSCGTVNTVDVRFCFKCGSKLNASDQAPGQAKPKQLKQAKKTRAARDIKQPVVTPVKIAVAAFIAIFIYIVLPEEKTTSSPSSSAQGIQPISAQEQKLADPVMEAKALDIASKFVCSCGTCGEESLETCTCEVAQVERQFIRNRIQNKTNPETIIKEVNSKYGWIKPQFESTYGPGKFKFDKNQVNSLTPSLDITERKNDLQLASFTDRSVIISNFTCVCGKCTDLLRDCTCEHPGGAIEVKNYIDQKINQEKYTIENIIQLVDAKYGNTLN